MVNIMGILNDRIKQRRLELGMTLLQLANKLNVKEATMQRYESGEIKNIKHETIVKLAEILHCSPSYLMGWQNYNYNTLLSENEERLLSIYRNLNSNGQDKLLERAEELKNLGYTAKGDGQKMA